MEHPYAAPCADGGYCTEKGMGEPGFCVCKERMECLADLIALAASQMGGLAAVQGRKDYEPRHKDIINRAQRLLGGRELT